MVSAVGTFRSVIEELSTARGGVPAKQSGTIYPDEKSSIHPLDQGNTNGCGTTSLAMIMSYLLGREIDRKHIDDEIRRLDSFSSPRDLVAYARQAGLNAEMYNHGSPEELARFVDAGVPTQILVSSDGSGDISSMHYVVVTGYERDATGRLAFTLLDPAGGRKSTWSAAELERKWGDTPAGFDHFFMAFARAGTPLPPSRTDDIEGALNAIDGAAQVVVGIDRITDPDSPGEFIRGLGDVGVGAPQAIAGAIMAGTQFGLSYIEEQVRATPVVGQPLAHAFHEAGEDVGEAGEVLSESATVRHASPPRSDRSSTGLSEAPPLGSQRSSVISRRPPAAN